MAEEKKLVIIGGGIAGVSAALAARLAYPDAEITVLNAEDEPFYCRIALGSLMSGALPKEYLASFAPDFLPARRILYLSGVAATAIDKEHHIVTAGGREFPYDSLILASGATPFVPPIPGLKEAAHLLWTMTDAEKLAKELKSHKEPRIAIIGGGVLAIESALMLAKKAKITIFEVGNHLMPRQLNEKAAALLQKMLEERGIAVNCKAQITAITAEENVYTLTMPDGQKLTCDLILAQAGVRPESRLAREAGLEVKNGIIVNEAMQTSDPAILACGNVAEYNGNLELLWNPARRQGEVAGTNAFAIKDKYQAEAAELHLKSREIALFSVGNREEAASMLEESGADSYRALFFNKDDELIAAILLGNISYYPQISQAINSRRKKPDGAPGNSLAAFLASLGALTDADGHTMDWDGKRWVCRQCGYSYEGLLPPAVCPVCHVGRDQFIPA